MDLKDVQECFMHGVDCGQVVAGEFEKETGLSKEVLRKLTAGYGGGMMRGETCGLVIAAYNVLGAIYGHSEKDEDEQKGIFLTKMFEFNDKFTSTYSGLMCREVLGANIATKEGSQKIQEENLMMTLCPQAAVDTIEMLHEIIDGE